jgi:hypothetical protein
MAQEWERVSMEELKNSQGWFRHRFGRFDLKILPYTYSNLAEHLRAFLSRHGPRLSRACAGQIDGCIRALEDGPEVPQLPDLRLSSGEVYRYAKLRVSRRRWCDLAGAGWSDDDSDSDAPEGSTSRGLQRGPSGSSGGGGGARQPHEEWLWLHEYKGILDARKEFTDQLRRFLSRHGPRLSQACAGRIGGCIRALEDGSEDFQLPDLEPNTPGVTLRFRPGSANPEDPALLDALEEVIYHTVRSGNEAEAYRLYSGRMGGREHLGKVLGEFARGARILRYFSACPNDLDLAWYLRGVGDLRASYDLLSRVRPIWSGAVLCLQGFLPRVVREEIGWEHSQVIAAFLMGRAEALDPPFDLGWGEALVNADLPTMRGDLARARALAAADLNKFKGMSTHVPEQVRTRLVLAEVDRRQGHAGKALAGLEREAPWIMRSGSVEHLGLYHLIRSRVLTDRGEYEAADSESLEGLLLARQCGLGLAHVDFLNLRARLALARARSIPDRDAPQRSAFLEAAARSALGALNGILMEGGDPAPRPDLPLDDLVAFGARHPECQYAWGAADALALLGEVLAEQGHASLARDALRQAVDRQSTLRHPDLARTDTLLSRLGRRG